MYITGHDWPICDLQSISSNVMSATGHDYPICDLQSDRDRMISSDDSGAIILWTGVSQMLKQILVITWIQ